MGRDKIRPGGQIAKSLIFLVDGKERSMEQSIRLTVLGACAVAVLAISGPPAAAQTASLVYDFGSKAPFARPPIGLPSGLGQSFSIGERLFFATGPKLWVTDGKPNGTRSLNDLCRGACPAAKLVNRLEGLAFFAAGNPTGPLWRSDGTVQGTFEVTPPGWYVALPAGGDPFHPLLDSSSVSLGGRLYFLACQGDGRTCGLWGSDGTK
ncbi:MAG: hypothetical protein QOJ16_1918, partial [Acidobacteriota bacterium]|nr:hypothetical protein [Acidobacteriota bacterium]